MLENPTVYINVDDDIDNIPNNVNIIYVTQGADLNEDGDVVLTTTTSDTVGQGESGVPDFDNEQSVTDLFPPYIIGESFSSTPYELADGSVVADISFSVEDVPDAAYYEVRYTS